MRALLVRLVIVVLAVAEPVGWAAADLHRGDDVGRSEIGSGPSDAAPACLTNRAEWQSPASDAARRPIGITGRLAGHSPSVQPICWLHELWTWPSAGSPSLQTEHVRLQI